MTSCDIMSDFADWIADLRRLPSNDVFSDLWFLAYHRREEQPIPFTRVLPLN